MRQNRRNAIACCTECQQLQDLPESLAHISALCAGDSWFRNGTNLILLGPRGGGKSHLGSASGHALIDAGYRVLFTRTSELVQKLQAARQSLQLPSALAKLDRFDLIMLDDLSYALKDQAETSVLFELIAERYERRSLLTSNLDFSEWGDAFPDNRILGAATRDRLRHGAYRVVIEGESFRKPKPMPENSENAVAKSGKKTHS
ncbi:ATP-binding protein [Paraburkholderia caribensis]|uniref:ATP-binding protein n=1 Tax=Paraburkholderia caribensis TaxID=75105 RepID=UPI002698E025